MKTRLISVAVLILSGLTVFSTSCNKDEDTSTQILYPTDGFYGKNIICDSQFDIEVVDIFNDSANITEIGYSIRADLEEEAYLKVIITHEIEYPMAFSGSLHNGWINTSSNDSIILHVSGPEVCDMWTIFIKHGSSKIEIFENNSTTPNRIKEITY